MSHKWWVLIAMTSCVSMIFIDVTVLPVTLPTVQHELNLSETSLQWIVNAYILVLATLVLAGGRLGDRFGRRRIFCWGVLLFGLSSAFCGLSFNEPSFIFSRALQGVGGAMLFPATAAIIVDTFPEGERGRAIGIYTSVGSVFLAIGPFIGGLFTEYLSWRYVFWMNLPIAAIGFLLTMRFVDKSLTHFQKFDWPGFMTFSTGLVCIIVGLMQTHNWGWTDPIVLSLMISGVILLAFLGFVDRKVEHPYIDFKLFQNRVFTGTIIAIFCTQFVVMVTVFWNIYFQNALLFTPAETGLLNLICNAPLIITAPLGGYISDRYGPKLPTMLGFTIVAASFIWFLQVYDTKNIPLMLSALIPFGSGIPLIFTPSFTTLMEGVPERKRGLASGTANMIRQFGATLGFAIFGSIFLSLLDQRLLRAQINPEQFSGLLAKTKTAMSAFNDLSNEAQAYVWQSTVKASSDAFWGINLLALIVTILGLIAILVLYAPGKKR